MNERLRETRKKAGDSQTKTADYLGILQEQYSRYESGKRQMPIDVLKKFCEHYNVSADYILDIHLH